MQKKYLNSIFNTNFLILLVLAFSNIVYFLYEWIKDVKIQFLIINFWFLILLFVVNLIYRWEYNSWKLNIREIIKNTFSDSESMKELLITKMKYKENDEIYNLFKSLFVRKNIISKDYLDLKNLFFKMVPENFINEVGESWIEKIALGVSIKKHLNVMFLDIIWFTTIAEHLPEDRTLLLLNIYFDWIVEVIKKYWWNVDKFLWDWMMIVFDDKNTDNSLKASIEIQNFISKFQVSDIWKKISIWIWINSWEVILWTIWSKERMEITLIWDVVNTASRLEWLTRNYEEKIIISEHTYKLLENKDDFKINKLGLKEIKWKQKKIQLYWVEPLINIKI